MERLLSIGELATALGVPINTVYQWNSKGTGPTYVRVGRHVRYQPSQVDKWLNEQAADGAGQ